MSPLVTLVLLCAASALLAVVKSNPGQCTEKGAGQQTDVMITLPRVTIADGVVDAKIDTIDNCQKQRGSQVVGVNIHACDYQTEPSVVLTTDPPFTPILVHRNGDASGEATVDIYQFCNA